MTRVARYERRVEAPMLLLALAFVAAYAWPILDASLSRTLESRLTALSWMVWVAFAVDFVVRVSLSDNRRMYMVRHWYDALLITLPALRPLRLLRLVTVFRLLQRTSSHALAVRTTVYVAGAALLSLVLGALAVLDAERGATGATIAEFHDALWWGFVTVTTVGYGDLYPVTATGRLVAAGLMAVGIALMGSITASLATWFVATDREEQSS